MNIAKSLMKYTFPHQENTTGMNYWTENPLIREMKILERYRSMSLDRHRSSNTFRQNPSSQSFPNDQRWRLSGNLKKLERRQEFQFSNQQNRNQDMTVRKPRERYFQEEVSQDVTASGKNRSWKQYEASEFNWSQEVKTERRSDQRWHLWDNSRFVDSITESQQLPSRPRQADSNRNPFTYRKKYNNHFDIARKHGRDLAPLEEHYKIENKEGKHQVGFERLAARHLERGHVGSGESENKDIVKHSASHQTYNTTKQNNNLLSKTIGRRAGKSMASKNENKNSLQSTRAVDVPIQEELSSPHDKNYEIDGEAKEKKRKFNNKLPPLESEMKHMTKGRVSDDQDMAKVSSRHKTSNHSRHSNKSPMATTLPSNISSKAGKPGGMRRKKGTTTKYGSSETEFPRKGGLTGSPLDEEYDDTVNKETRQIEMDQKSPTTGNPEFNKTKTGSISANGGLDKENTSPDKTTKPTLQANNNYTGEGGNPSNARPRKKDIDRNKTKNSARKHVENSGVYEKSQREILKWMASNYGRVIDIFKRFDVDNSGSLSLEEFYQGMKSLGAPASQVELYMMAKALDYDGDETIDYREFRQIKKMYKKSAKKQRTVEYETECLKLQPCDKCCIGISEIPVNTKEPRHITLQLMNILEDPHKRSTIGPITRHVEPEFTIYGIQRLIKAELGGSVANVRIFRKQNNSVEVLEQDRSLADYGYTGGVSSDQPQHVSLLYDYAYPGMDCPLLLASSSK